MHLEPDTWSVSFLYGEGNRSSSTPTFHTHPWCCGCQNHYLFAEFVVSAGGKVGNLYRPPENRHTHTHAPTLTHCVVFQPSALSPYRYSIIGFAQPPKTWPSVMWCTSSDTASKSIVLSEISAPLGINLEREKNKQGNLERSGSSKINGFATTNLGQLFTMEQRGAGDDNNRSVCVCAKWDYQRQEWWINDMKFKTEDWGGLPWFRKFSESTLISCSRPALPAPLPLTVVSRGGTAVDKRGGSVQQMWQCYIVQ